MECNSTMTMEMHKLMHTMHHNAWNVTELCKRMWNVGVNDVDLHKMMQIAQQMHETMHNDVDDGETPQLNTEKHAIAQMHEFASEMVNSMENMDGTGRIDTFSPIVVEMMYFMGETIKSQPQWLESWITWWNSMEWECMDTDDIEHIQRFVKQWERRLNWMQSIENM